LFIEVAYYFLTNVLVNNARSQKARKIGIFMKSLKIGLMHSLNKLVLETYIDMALATFLMIYSFLRRSHGKYLFSSFFKTPTDIICSVLTLLFLFVVLVAPLHIFMLTKKHIKA
jgi:hypothetical protein